MHVIVIHLRNKRSYISRPVCSPMVLTKDLINLAQSNHRIERGMFVQILNASDSHWITIVNVGCFQGEVHAYDSMADTDLPN